MEKRLRQTPVLGGPVSIGLACTVGGALLGCLPTALSYLVDFSGGPLRMIKKISAPGDFIASAIIGAIVGFICLWFAIPILIRRPLRRVFLIVALISAPAVIGVSFALDAAYGDRNSMGLLMFLSACAFLGACLLAAWKTPRHEEDVGVCAQCGYDLRGSLESGRCPECGLTFYPQASESHTRNLAGKVESAAGDRPAKLDPR